MSVRGVARTEWSVYNVTAPRDAGEVAFGANLVVGSRWRE
jgi:hypothetical protein